MVVYRQNLLAVTLFYFLYIAALIWTSTILPSWLTISLAILGILGIRGSWRNQGDTRADIGICPEAKNFGVYWLGLLWTLIALIVVVAIGAVITPEFWKDHDFVKKLDRVGVGYILSAFLQELLLHGYFTNRIGKVFEGRHAFSAFIVGAMFWAIHFPNPVLMPATGIFAGVSAYFFLAKSRNIYLLTFAHIILSTATKHFIAAPLLGHGCMRIGPGYWN